MREFELAIRHLRVRRTQRKSVEKRVGGAGIKSVCLLFESVLKNIARIEEHRTCSLTNAHRHNWMLLTELAISGKPSHHDWKTGKSSFSAGKSFRKWTTLSARA